MRSPSFMNRQASPWPKSSRRNAEAEQHARAFAVGARAELGKLQLIRPHDPARIPTRTRRRPSPTCSPRDAGSRPAAGAPARSTSPRAGAACSRSPSRKCRRLVDRTGGGRVRGPERTFPARRGARCPTTARRHANRAAAANAHLSRALPSVVRTTSPAMIAPGWCDRGLRHRLERAGQQVVIRVEMVDQGARWRAPCPC